MYVCSYIHVHVCMYVCICMYVATCISCIYVCICSFFGMIPVAIWHEYHTSVFAVYVCMCVCIDVDNGLLTVLIA